MQNNNVMEMNERKRDLLTKYATREPRRFSQFDAFREDGSDSLMQPDEDGHWLSRGTTWELMAGADVRVMVEPKLGRLEAARMLRKIATWIERDGVDVPVPPPLAEPPTNVVVLPPPGATPLALDQVLDEALQRAAKTGSAVLIVTARRPGGGP